MGGDLPKNLAHWYLLLNILFSPVSVFSARMFMAFPLLIFSMSLFFWAFLLFSCLVFLRVQVKQSVIEWVIVQVVNLKT